jgi:uncharacterized membrane protein YjfL (UPF0719 family)
VPELSLVEATATSLGVHLVFGVLAMFVGAIAVLGVDRFVLRRISLEEEIGKGNIAAAIFAGAMWIALALIMTHTG